jgi:hypothetical protein
MGAGFVSGGQSWGGRVVVRVFGHGWVWAQRVASSRPGSWPAGASVCVPFAGPRGAFALARALSRIDWAAWARRGRRCGSAWEVKVVLPPGVRVAALRAAVGALAVV